MYLTGAALSDLGSGGRPARRLRGLGAAGKVVTLPIPPAPPPIIHQRIGTIWPKPIAPPSRPTPPILHGLGILPIVRAPIAPIRSRGVFTYNPTITNPQPWGGQPPPMWGGNPLTNAGNTQRVTSIQKTALNPAGGPPSTIQNYDKAGNPIYSVPPPGQAITGYDQYGTPLYGAPPAGLTVTGMQNGVPVYGSQSLSPYGAVVSSYDQYGTPIYSTPPAGQTIIAYDPLNNPIYGVPGEVSPNSYALPGGGISTAAPSAGGGAPATAAPASGGTDYSSILDWLSQETLISGIPNWGIAAALAGGFLFLQSRGKR